MEVMFYPNDEEKFKKEAVGNFVHTEVTDLSTNEVFAFSREVTRLWTSSCKNNILTDHRIKALKGNNYTIKSWIESYASKSIKIDSKNDSETSYWLVSSKPSLYDSIEGFKNYSEIDWGNASNNKIKTGDIVYIYIAKPLQKIAIKTLVVKSGYGEDELLGNEGQFNRDAKKEVCEHFIRLKFIKFLDSNFLGIDYLHKHGINGNIQGKRRIPKQTLSYIQYHEKDYDNVISIEELNKDLEEGIHLSKNTSHRKRKERLENANNYPEEIEIRSRGFKRNPDVVFTVLNRANGICERCGNKAPFNRKKDNTPYLEVHHKIQLSVGGEDTVKNAIAVCPNCHRELHFG